MAAPEKADISTLRTVGNARDGNAVNIRTGHAGSSQMLTEHGELGSPRQKDRSRVDTGVIISLLASLPALSLGNTFGQTELFAPLFRLVPRLSALVDSSVLS